MTGGGQLRLTCLAGFLLCHPCQRRFGSPWIKIRRCPFEALCVVGRTVIRTVLGTREYFKDERNAAVRSSETRNVIRVPETVRSGENDKMGGSKSSVNNCPSAVRDGYFWLDYVIDLGSSLLCLPPSTGTCWIGWTCGVDASPRWQ